MTAHLNPARGEAVLQTENAAIMLRPSFAALVAAEAELGSLFALVERAAEGQLKLSEMVALFWHCRHDAPPDISRAAFAEEVVAAGLSAATPALKSILVQILGAR
ncbi:gene transfer agent family protein [Sphingorhabdus sp. IMCC26285]|uniref:Gene transfer agent family protein n=1 Tax=Sphingorhabdus profundilacus TaxID=2509718 RepID=A0A6I4LWK4_9SPHN|nr:GTA-gp10 family protein [Sphingorhabdus profundilacus]MVZ97782.1 gene transfer agent family protein [Sphingorhabdus profundilacus]